MIKRFNSVDQLPDDVKQLPVLGQEAWMRLFNAAESRGDTQASASEFAWGKVQEEWQQNDDGTWTAKGSVMVEFVNKTRKDGIFKTFIPFETDENGRIKVFTKEVGGKTRKFLKGVASNTEIDKENERVTREFIAKMKESALGMTVFAEHEHHLDKTLGFIDEVYGDEDTFGTVIALEPEWHPKDNPTGNRVVTSILNKIDHGTRIGQSIGGIVTKARDVFDKNVGQKVRELVDGELLEDSVTAMPAINLKAGEGWLAPLLKSMNEMVEHAQAEKQDEERMKEETEQRSEPRLKVLDEMVERDEVQTQISDLYWSYQDAVWTILHDDEMDAQGKRGRIDNLSDEFADRVETLADRLAELTVVIDEQLN